MNICNSPDNLDNFSMLFQTINNAEYSLSKHERFGAAFHLMAFFPLVDTMVFWFQLQIFSENFQQ